MREKHKINSFPVTKTKPISRVEVWSLLHATCTKLAGLGSLDSKIF